MQSLYITIERDRLARSSSEGARFRVLVRLQPGARPLLVGASFCSSVARGKREAEIVFGDVVWREESTDVRASAFLESAR